MLLQKKKKKKKKIVKAKHKDYVGESCKLHVHICLFFL